MDFVEDFEKLSISKKNKPKNEQVQLTIIKVLADKSVLKINQCAFSNSGGIHNKINNALSYIKVNKNEDEFQDIKILFSETDLIVKSVRKVINPYLKKAFELKRHLEYGGKSPRRLYHGTKDKYVDNICTYNFDWRLNGMERGHRYGKGVNFSSSPYFATFFCDKKWKKVMIIVDVLICNVKGGTGNTTVPPKGVDTTTGKNETVYVKFYDNEFYPRYIVDFSRKYN